MDQQELREYIEDRGSQKIIFNRVTIPFTINPLLTEASYPYYYWLRSLNSEKGLYLSCNYGKGGKKVLCCIRQHYTTIDIICISKFVTKWDGKIDIRVSRYAFKSSNLYLI